MKLNANELQSLRQATDPCEAMQEIFDESKNADQIPLDSFCEMGGAPDPEDPPEIHVNGAESDSEHCRGVLTAYFNEVVYGGGCPDMPTRKPRQGDVSFKVSLADGTVKFD